MKISFEKAIDVVQNKLIAWAESGIAMLPNFLLALVVLLIFVIVARFSKKLVLKINHKVDSNQTIVNLLSNILFLGIVGLGLFASLSILQLDKTVTSLLAGAGILGLALGLAFQETASNFLAGILMAFRKPVAIGDLVRSNEEMGVVIDLSLRAITIRNFTGQLIFIPNKNVLYNPIVNYTRNGKRRVDLEIGVSYGEDLQKVKVVTLKAVDKLKAKYEIADTNLWYTGFGDSSINFIVAAWLPQTFQPSYFDLRSDMVMAVKAAYDENHITIPFPIRTLDFGIKGGKTLSQMNLSMASGDGKQNER